jgi:hypothetical protein
MASVSALLLKSMSTIGTDPNIGTRPLSNDEDEKSHDVVTAFR